MYEFLSSDYRPISGLLDICASSVASFSVSLLSLLSFCNEIECIHVQVTSAAQSKEAQYCMLVISLKHLNYLKWILLSLLFFMFCCLCISVMYVPSMLVYRNCDIVPLFSRWHVIRVSKPTKMGSGSDLDTVVTLEPKCNRFCFDLFVVVFKQSCLQTSVSPNPVRCKQLIIFKKQP